MKKFVLPCPGMFIGKVEHRPVKDSSGAIVGETTYVTLEYRGGWVKVEIDRAYAEQLKPDTEGTALIEMQPCMSGKTLTTAKGQFAIIDSGFDSFKLVAFEPVGAKKAI